MIITLINHESDWNHNVCQNNMTQYELEPEQYYIFEADADINFRE